LHSTIAYHTIPYSCSLPLLMRQQFTLLPTLLTEIDLK
jgi:hypothetical protein